jgi:trypsin
MNRKVIVALSVLSLNACMPDGQFETHEGEIVGGERERIRDVPWQVTIRDKEFGHVCGGSIIDAWNVLTARHCVRAPHGQLVIPALFEVAAGVSKLSQIDADAQVVDVEDFLPLNDRYDEVGPHGNDILVVRLAKPLVFGPKVQPIALATAADERAGRMRPGVIATVTGFGATSVGGPPSDRLLSVDVPIVSHAAAEAAAGTPLASDLLAAGGKEGEDSCRGDSGGPLTVRKGYGRILAGVVSFGLADTEACGIPGKPGFYTRVAAYAGAIAQTTRLRRAVIDEVKAIAGATELQLISVEVPAGQRVVSFQLSGGTGDADLFVRQGQAPTETEFDCVSGLVGITAESCTFFNPTPGTYFVGVIGNTPFASAELNVHAYAPAWQAN